MELTTAQLDSVKKKIKTKIQHLEESPSHIGRTILVYQMIPGAPPPPFKVVILTDHQSHWGVRYIDLTGETICRRVLKAACQTTRISNP